VPQFLGEGMQLFSGNGRLLWVAVDVDQRGSDGARVVPQFDLAALGHPHQFPQGKRPWVYSADSGDFVDKLPSRDTMSASVISRPSSCLLATWYASAMVFRVFSTRRRSRAPRWLGKKADRASKSASV